jgi:hypothetical protein
MHKTALENISMLSYKGERLIFKRIELHSQNIPKRNSWPCFSDDMYMNVHSSNIYNNRNENHNDHYLKDD